MKRFTNGLRQKGQVAQAPNVMLADYRIPSIVRKTNLPSPSLVVERFLDLVYTPDTKVDDLIDAVQGDAVITAKVLRAANSVMSSPVREIDNLKEAVLRIGMIPVINIITATELAEMFFSVPLPYGDINKLWEHNMLVACLASEYAKHHKLDNPGRWFNAGLMHDLGRLVLICHDSIKYHEAIAFAKEKDVELSSAEEEYFEYSHATIGGLLLKFWNLPDDYVNAAANHHSEFRSIEDYASGIAICNKLANELLLSEPPNLQHYEELPLDRILESAIETFEMIKKATRINTEHTW